MAISIDWATGTINVPQSYLTPVAGVFYELDVHQLKKDVSALLASAIGIVFDDAFIHATSVTMSGVVYDRFVTFLYDVDFESGAYVVNCTGANHNIADVKSADIPSIIVNNSAGRTVVTQDVPAPPVVVLGGDIEVDVLEDEISVDIIDEHHDILVEVVEAVPSLESDEVSVAVEQDEKTTEVEV